MTTGASDIHISHRARPLGVFGSKARHIKTGRANEVVRLPIQMATSRHMAPDEAGRFRAPNH